LFGGAEAVAEVRRHIDEIAGFERVRDVAEMKFAFAGEHLHDGVLGGGMFGEFLALGKAEKGDAGIGRAQQRAAHDAVGSELGFLRQRQDFFTGRINQRFLIHASTLADGKETRVDVGQGN